MKLSSLALLFLTVVINLTLWTQINKPFHLVESHYPINSFSYNPFQKNQAPWQRHVFTESELEGDIKLLSEKTKTLRIYSALGGLEHVPELAKKYGMTVIVSAFLDSKDQFNNNVAEVESAINLAKKNKNVSQVIIGNETQLHQTVPTDELIGYLKKARKELKTPVSTAEPWDFWVRNPDFAKEVDFVAIHALPYWNEIAIEKAVDYVIERYNAVKSVHPKKMVMIAETGWPSDGPQHGPAQASQANQAMFIRDFITRMEPLKISYNIIEAFDQPWKSTLEGNAGEHWGIMDADRHDKFPIGGPVFEDPNWKYWAISSSILGFLAIALFFFRRPHIGFRAKIFSIVIFQLAAVAATQLARDASDQYMSPSDIAFWTVMVSMQALLAIIFLTDAVEIADVVGHKPLLNYFKAHKGSMADYPFVSIHVACCREPPEMVIMTVKSLLEVDYPNYEIIVVDNNTPDPALWKPIEEFCSQHTDKVRFFSLGSWPGFKAGALNFALRETNPKAKIIGVVDADYVVDKIWLKATIPYFLDDSNVAVVQAPQEHRDWEESLFQTMENDEYSGFFRIGMVQRNEHNAIIQHGTMTLIDKATMDSLKGWAEWCICEDAELGLRILLQGKKAIYLDEQLGHGLVPDTYEAYAKQRFRWAYGAMRILRKHWGDLVSPKSKLTWPQRYQFFKGWLPWIGDALHMIFSLTAIAWSIVLIADPIYTDFPDAIFIYPALGLVLLRIFGTLWTYTARVKIGKRRTLLAAIAGGSLTHKIAKAIFQGLFIGSRPFYRTPKMQTKARLIVALSHVWEELFLATTLIVLAVFVIDTFGLINDQAVIWASALVIQTFPYLAAIIASIISSSDTARDRRDEVKTVTA